MIEPINAFVYTVRSIILCVKQPRNRKIYGKMADH